MQECSKMEEENEVEPLFRVTTFGRFVVERLISSSCEQPPQYEPMADQVWRSRFAACDLLKLLLCRSQRRAPKDVLIEALWPEAEITSATHNCDSAISRLRSILTVKKGESLLLTVRAGNTIFYELPPQQTIWTDMDAFLTQLAQVDQAVSRGHDPVSLLEAAWNCAVGVFLEDNLYSSWAHAKRHTIMALRHRVLHQLVELYSQRGRSDQAERLLLFALEEEPTDEDSVCHLMTLLEQQGRRQEALRYYERLVTVLKEETASKPLASTQTLAERLRTAPLLSSSALTILEEGIDISITATPRGRSEQALVTVTVPLMASREHQHISLPSSKQKIEMCTLNDPVSSCIVSQGRCYNDLLLYRIIKEVCSWTHRYEAYDLIQQSVDRLIRSYETMEQGHEREYLLSRRDALSVIAGLPLALLSIPEQAHAAGLSVEEFLIHCSASITTCWHLIRESQFDLVSSVLSGYLPTLESIAFQPSKHQKVAAALATQGWLIASLLALHQNNLSLRESHCQQAIKLSQLTDDVNLTTAARMALAVTYCYSRHPVKALQTFQQAMGSIKQVSPLIQGGIYIKMANAYAQCNQTQEAIRCLRLAHEFFPDRPEHDPCFLFVDGGHFTLTLWEGLTYLDLDLPHDAWNSFATMANQRSGLLLPERARIEIINRQAETAVALGDQERFCAFLEVGVTGAKALKSEKRYNESVEVYTQAKRLWPYEPGVQVLQELFVK